MTPSINLRRTYRQRIPVATHPIFCSLTRDGRQTNDNAARCRNPTTWEDRSLPGGGVDGAVGIGAGVTGLRLRCLGRERAGLLLDAPDLCKVKAMLSQAQDRGFSSASYLTPRPETAKPMQPFLFVTDLDNTFVGDDRALEILKEKLLAHRQAFGTKIVYATGRSLPSFQGLAAEKTLPTPDALVTSVGTEIYFDLDRDTPSETWAQVQSPGWKREVIAAIAAQYPELTPQPPIGQGPFKVSFFLEEAIAAALLTKFEAALKAADLTVQLVYSGGKDLDVLPQVADKGRAVQFLQQHWGETDTRTVVCGDSGNDIALFANGSARGIIVGNARPELRAWHIRNQTEHRYLAQSHYAAGILEGLEHFRFL